MILTSEEGAKKLAKDATARDFVSDAYAHCKFIGYGTAAEPLLKGAGIFEMLDKGCMALKSADAAPAFIEKCRDLRYWKRETSVDQT